MSVEYLFRIDQAKDNDVYFETTKKQGVNTAYAGVEIKIGQGWVPDLVRVSCQDLPEACILTLIELETSKPEALKSSRKYLPESSAHILEVFQNYLDRVIENCRATADPRRSTVEGLRVFLGKQPKVVIETACALRSGSEYLEKLPLLAQLGEEWHSSASTDRPPREKSVRLPELNFETNLLSLTRYQSIALNRAVLILDAIVQKRDHSASVMKNWVNLYLKSWLTQNSACQEKFPSVYMVLSADKTVGHKLTIQCDIFFEELSRYWSEPQTPRMTPEKARRWISGYYPVACSLNGKDRVQQVFANAKLVIAEL